MPTIGNFTDIEDDEVDAESPITESLVTRLRDNAYWVNAGTTKTSESGANKFLETDGSGGVQWTDTTEIGADGTKGTSATFAKISNRILIISGYAQDISNKAYAGPAFIDTSDDTLVSGSNSFTISGSNQVWATLDNSSSNLDAAFSIRLTGGNYIITFGDDASGASYLYI
jgi:hypothetical protein